MEEQILITPVDPITFELQDYSVQDSDIIAKFEIDTVFSQSTDYIEYFVFDETENLIFPPTTQELLTYSIKNGDVLLSPDQDLSRLGFDEGIYFISYNFYRKRLASSISSNYFISNISSDRTEIILDSNTIPSGDIISSTNEFIQYRNQSDYFVLIESIRSTADEVIELAHNVIENTINSERPWVIIDTANATLDIENENDNSQVGAFMAALKQTIFTKLNTSICIITHTAKTMSKEDDSAMARGASAYTGDATLTAVLFMDEENNRYLRLIKTRYEPVFREILLISHIHHEAVINRHGNMQDVNCVIVSPQASKQ